MAEPRLSPTLDDDAPDPPPRVLSRREAARRSFLRLASHELRTPLNAILGFSEIIAEEIYGPVSEPRYREHAELIRESGQRLLKLVTEILDIARLELGAMEMVVRPEPVNAVMADAVRATAEAAAAAGVFLTMRIAPGADWVQADARALCTALAHLLANAVAASPRGSAVRLEASRLADGRVSLEVADCGPGIAPEEISRLMRPFEQGGDPLAGHAGAGLGLPTTRLLCEAMGGQLRVRPSPEGGLSAAIRLHAPSAAEAEGAAVPWAASAPRPA